MNSKTGNKSIKKRLLRIVLKTLLILIAIPVVISLIFQFPAVQTYTARIVTNQISKDIDQTITVERIKLGIFSGISLRNLQVFDHRDEIMLGVVSLSAMPIFTDFNFTKIRLSKVTIDSVDFRLGSYQGDPKDNYSMMVSNFTGEKKEGGSVFKLLINDIELSNSKVNVFNENREYDNSEKMMDYGNIIFYDASANITDFKLIGDSLNFRVDNLWAKENSGLNVKSLQTDFIVSSSCMEAKNAIAKVNNSSLDLDFRLDYNSYKSLGSFIDSVVMSGDIRPTIIDISDIGHFSDILFQMPNEVGVIGDVYGTVKDLSCTGVKIKYGENTRVSGDIYFKGLPDFYSTHMLGNNLRITSTPRDFSSFYLPISSKHIDLTESIPPDEQITFTGVFDGYYEDFKSQLEFEVKQGKIESQIRFSNKDQIELTTTLKADSINIGGYLKMDEVLGYTSFNLATHISGNSIDDLTYEIDGKITNTDLLDYNYRRIGISGLYFNDSITAYLRVGDKNLMMSGNLRSRLGETPSFFVNADIVKANLYELKLLQEIPLEFSSKVQIELEGTDLKTLNTDILFTNNDFVFKTNQYLIDTIYLTKHTTSDLFTKTVLKSDIANIVADGYYNLETVSTSFFNLTNHYYNYFDINEPFTSSDSTISLDLNIKKTKILAEQFLYGVRIAPNTRLKSHIDFSTNNIDLILSSHLLKLNSMRADSTILNLNTVADSLILEFAIGNLILKDSTPTDSVILGIDNFSVSSRIYQDSIIAGLSWDNYNPEHKDMGVMEGYIAKISDTTNISIGMADIFINNVRWKIDPGNLITSYDDRTIFKDFNIAAGNSTFKLSGTLPREEHDSLVAQFQDWDLANFDLLTKPRNFYLRGQINGELKLSMILDNPTIISNIRIKDFGLNGELLGDASIMNSWDNTDESVFLKTSIVRHGNVGQGEIFNATGYYYPFRKDGNTIDIDIGFDKFKLKTIEPFLSTFISEMEGTTNGNVKISGTFKKPVITGRANMQRAGMRVVYLNTRYSFSNSIDFIENGITFDNLVIYDTIGNNAQIDGRLTHNYFNDPKFDIKITTDGLLFFNTEEHMNELYYGSAIASGRIDISGSPSDVKLGISATTQRGTSVTLPLDYSVEISDKDYIIFTNNDTTNISIKDFAALEDDAKSDELNYDINIDLNVTPEAQVGINLPDDMGSISARGTSNLALDVNSNGDFSLVGDYLVQNGLFQFRIGNLVNKRFELVQGGRISWSGNPYSANVSIKGLYKVKTSLSSLGVEMDSTTSYKNRVTVECYVVLTDELLNPNIRFEIKFPDLDPDYQRAVFAELDTTNTAMMNQQMISLLVLGTFSFNNAANVSLQSSYYNVIANQLSSMLSQISKNVDIGLNYKPGDQVSSEEFEVALSTQLFDNRLTIDGNFGMTYDRTEQSASNIVGDVDIGYKLTPDGQWVLKVFNHSNVNSWYNYSGYDQTSPYTQGVGIAFRKDFNNIKDLFTSKKKKKEQKAEKDANKSATKDEEEE